MFGFRNRRSSRNSADHVVGAVIQAGHVDELHVHRSPAAAYAVTPFVPVVAGTGIWAKAPSELLKAEQAEVPFTGRDSELADLGAWRDAFGEADIRLLHGRGGMGKTRTGLDPGCWTPDTLGS
ncbi:hypothetical protein ACIQMJ_40560 [Actinosynnema sp. NPDC091369]